MRFCWVRMISPTAEPEEYLLLQGFRARRLAWLYFTNWSANLPGFMTLLIDLHQEIQPEYSARLDRWLMRELHQYQPDALARVPLPCRNTIAASLADASG